MSNAIRGRLPATQATLTPATVEPRAPGPGEVQIRLRASSLTEAGRESAVRQWTYVPANCEVARWGV